MTALRLSDGEWKLMNLLWDAAPEALTIGALVDALKKDTGWTKATVNVMLTRLSEKGAVGVDASGRAKLFTPLVSREQAVRQEASNALSRVRGGAGLLLSAMAERCELSDAEIEDLYRILKEGRGRG
ncbi:MAG: BlaI/MecI/CopY family transcriptional regulator [Oscillospiraceae bacterium]|nr:BlaI/MecI/CopY family transcriptional regulator [Oscillospiraceae bacterium]